MNKTLISLVAAGLSLSSTAFSQTIPLMQNTDMSSYTGWVVGANVYKGTAWNGWRYVPQDFSYADRAEPEGNGIRMRSWDDNVSDKIEMFYLQEHNAGPAGGGFENQIFEIGDTLVFKGTASAIRNDVGTANMITRAFIKFLGYKEVAPGVVDPRQTYGELTVYHNIGTSSGAFEITATYPDSVNGTPLSVDNPLTIIQIGFEIATVYDTGVKQMDSGSIYAEGIQAYIERTSGTPQWAGFDIGEDGWVDTGSWMGLVNVTNDPWIWVENLAQYLYIPADATSETGAWVYAIAP